MCVKSLSVVILLVFKLGAHMVTYNIPLLMSNLGYILKNQLFALKYTLKHSLIKTISTPTCFGLIRPSSGSCCA